MSTLATREQSEAIRKQMRSIRSDLPYVMDDAREDLRQLADWKYYVRRLPLASLAAAFAIGYFAAPDKPKRIERESESLSWLQKFQPRCRSVEEEREPEQETLVGGLMGAVAAMLLRAGVSLAIRQFGQSVLGSHSSDLASDQYK